MAEPLVYDKAKYHYDGNFPDDLEPEQGFVHTGMFLGWIIDHDLYSDWFGPEMRGYISAFKSRDMTGAKVFEACDGVLVDDMLTDEGNAFARDYFDFERGKYLADYSELLTKGLPSMYHVADTWPNYEKLKKRIDQRYRDWKGETSGGWRSIFRKRR
jgi:hypothetical protein